MLASRRSAHNSEGVGADGDGSVEEDIVAKGKGKLSEGRGDYLFVAVEGVAELCSEVSGAVWASDTAGVSDSVEAASWRDRELGQVEGLRRICVVVVREVGLTNSCVSVRIKARVCKRDRA